VDEEGQRRYRAAGTPWGTAQGDRQTISLRPDPDGGTWFRGFDYTLVANGSNPSACVEITLHHRRRRRADGPWAAEPLLLNTLRAGEWVRLELDSEETLALYRRLQDLYAICGQGVPRGDRSFQVFDEDDIVATGSLAEQIAGLIEANGQVALFSALDAVLPDPLSVIALKQEHDARAAALADFETHMAWGEWSELQWQSFFRANEWIFGHGLNYQFLVSQQSQPDYGGRDLSGAGGQRGDELFSTSGDWRFAVLVELKRPDTELLGNEEYRNGAWEIGEELSGGVTQLQANSERLTQEAQSRENVRYLDDRRMSVAGPPKAILLIGHTGQLDTDDKRATFERFRRNLWNPEVLTYDELLERARYLVERSAQQAGSDADRTATPARGIVDEPEWMGDGPPPDDDDWERDDMPPDEPPFDLPDWR
jgi:hypothetical protein